MSIGIMVSAPGVAVAYTYRGLWPSLRFAKSFSYVHVYTDTCFAFVKGLSPAWRHPMLQLYSTTSRYGSSSLFLLLSVPYIRRVMMMWLHVPSIYFRNIRAGRRGSLLESTVDTPTIRRSLAPFST